SSTLLYWLGDQDPEARATWELLDRRVENVMQFEKVKAQAQKNPLAKAAFALPNALLGMVRAPGAR
ncbi:MAG: COQ9 family protein, partial [Paracoccaceae bacterium]